MRFLSLVFFVAAACSTTPESLPSSTQAQGSPESVIIKFAWPVGSSAEVTEERKMSGDEAFSATLKYTLRFSSLSEGEFLLTHDDLSIEKILGETIDTDAEREEVAHITSQFSIPPLKISKSAKVSDVLWTDESLEKMLKAFEASDERVWTDDMRAEKRRLIRSPQVMGSVVAEARNTWNSWCKFFEATHTLNEPIRLKGAQASSALTLKELEQGYATLLYEVDYDSDRLLAEKRHALGPEVQKVTRKEYIEARLNVGTCLPQRVTRRQTINMTMKSNEVHQKIDEHRYSFKWKVSSQN